MAFSHTNSKGTTYYLNSKDVTLKSTGRVQTIYYFSKDERSIGLDAVPVGKKVKKILKLVFLSQKKA